MRNSHRRVLLGACLVGFWLSLLACWCVAPLLFYAPSQLDQSSCADVSVGARIVLAGRLVPVLLAQSMLYALPILFLIGMGKTSDLNPTRAYPIAAITLLLISLGLTWVRVFAGALACGSGFLSIVLLLAASVINLMLFIEAVSMARHYIVEPD